MACQGYDVELTPYDERGWRVTFYTAKMEHSVTADTASAFERTLWRAVVWRRRMTRNGNESKRGRR
jgi:hypothetical protein